MALRLLCFPAYGPFRKLILGDPAFEGLRPLPSPPALVTPLYHGSSLPPRGPCSPAALCLCHGSLPATAGFGKPALHVYSGNSSSPPLSREGIKCSASQMPQKQKIFTSLQTQATQLTKIYFFFFFLSAIWGAKKVITRGPSTRFASLCSAPPPRVCLMCLLITCPGRLAQCHGLTRTHS